MKQIFKVSFIYCIVYAVLLMVVLCLLYVYPKLELHLLMNSWHNSVLDTYLIDMRSRLVKLASQRSVIACLSGPRPSYAESLPYERDMDDRLSGIDLFNPIEDVLVLGDNGYVYNLNMRKNLLADYDFTACDWYRQAVRVENGTSPPPSSCSAPAWP